MLRVTVLLSIVLSVFATAVMSYVSMATPIGPWIAPTLVLCAMLFYALFYANRQYQAALVYVTIAGSIGGILATAFGFSFPTLYFLNPTLFNNWMARPVYFSSLVSAFACITAWYGMWIANVTESHFLHQEDLPFPIAQMIYKMMSAYNQIRKAWELAVGFLGTALFCVLQDGVRCVGGFVPKVLSVCRSFAFLCVQIPAVEFDLWPMLWAIGFVTGHIIVMPLMMGAFSKLVIVQPLHELFFKSMSQAEFLLAFCSGMVVAGVLQAFSPSVIAAMCKTVVASVAQKKIGMQTFVFNRALLLEGSALLVTCSAFLFYINCGLLLQVYLLVCTFICTYQIIVIAGKIGLAQLGRFATFVLVPALFLFNLDAVQIAVISTFVEAVAGVAVDLLCGRKVVQLANGSQPIARRYQYMGMLVSCAVIGIIFWLLINRFKLGSPELFAQRSQARQLLVGAKQFDYWVLLIGVAFGLILKKIKMNPMLVLGGLLMPMNISLGLVAGGLGARLVRNKEEWYPFWSGVFAANSIWMLARALV